MIGFALLLAIVGLFLSAFFSGSETGFYRATRIRLVLDALGGDLISRCLLWLTNNPSLFIATTLVGNNLANYSVSRAVVLAVQWYAGSNNPVAELFAPVILSPVLFVYGELLPKNLFLNSPNRLLRRGGPLFLFCVVLFFPVSILLWALNWLMARLVTHTPETVRLVIARRELGRLLEEGHQVGILHPSQRSLAQGIFAIAKRSVNEFVMRPNEFVRAPIGTNKQTLMQMAHQRQTPLVLLESPQDGLPQSFRGYIRVIDLGLEPSDEGQPVRTLMEIHQDTSLLSALVKMHDAGEEIAQVIDGAGKTIGVVTGAKLREPLFTNPNSDGA